MKSTGFLCLTAESQGAPEYPLPCERCQFCLHGQGLAALLPRDQSFPLHQPPLGPHRCCIFCCQISIRLWSVPALCSLTYEATSCSPRARKVLRPHHMPLQDTSAVMHPGAHDDAALHRSTQEGALPQRRVPREVRSVSQVFLSHSQNCASWCTRTLVSARAHAEPARLQQPRLRGCFQALMTQA